MTPAVPRRALSVTFTQAQLAASIAHCRGIARARARNFYYGMKLTPEPKRSAMYAVYAWMRAADDLADDPAVSDPAQRRRRIEVFHRQTLALIDPSVTPPDNAVVEPHDPMWPAVAMTLRDYPIDPAMLRDMVEGQLLDQEVSRYEHFDQLHDYCYKVASTVGLVCLDVWGYTGGEATRQLAEHRGIALQLTNILRDLVEDAQRDRVYLPADELARFGLDAARFRQQLLDRRADDAFDQLMAFQVDRARGYYQSSATLEEHIEPACRPTCWAMMRIYRGLLDKIAADPRRVLTQRVRLSSLHKMGIMLKAALGRGDG